MWVVQVLRAPGARGLLGVPRSIFVVWWPCCTVPQSRGAGRSNGGICPRCIFRRRPPHLGPPGDWESGVSRSVVDVGWATCTSLQPGGEGGPNGRICPRCTFCPESGSGAGPGCGTRDKATPHRCGRLTIRCASPHPPLRVWSPSATPRCVPTAPRCVLPSLCLPASRTTGDTLRSSWRSLRRARRSSRCCSKPGRT